MTDTTPELTAPVTTGTAVTPAEPAPTETAPASPAAGPHDKVAMLSINNDGSVAGNSPELIGDVDDVRAATRQQFTEQAVSAADVAIRGDAATSEPVTTTVTAEDGTTEEVTAPKGPPAPEEIKAVHDAAAEQAVAAADATVDALHTPAGDTA